MSLFSGLLLKLKNFLQRVTAKLTAILKGFSFRHLAILLNQDELRLAQSLYPYIKSGNILLQLLPLHAPFDYLPPSPLRRQRISSKLSNTCRE